MAARVTELFRYPVKGLSPEPLEHALLRAGDGFPADRRYAVARAPLGGGAAGPGPLPKTRFHMLMRDEALAALQTRFDDADAALSVARNGETVLRAALETDAGRDALARFLADYLGLPGDARPEVVRYEGHRFTDVSVVSPTHMNAVSLINLASVRALEEKLGRPVHPLRFRGNIYFEGGDAWKEFDWLDREFRVGPVRLKGLMRTKRCPATQVDPLTAQRDIDIPQEIKTHFGHMDMGIYAEVLTDGPVTPGDPVEHG